MTPACLNFLSLLGIYYSIPTFLSFWDVSLKFVLPALPFSYQWLPSVWICKGRCHHCAKLKTTTALASCTYGGHAFGQDCGHLEIVSRYRWKTGLNSALVFWHVIHGQMLQELSEKNMVNPWDFQHLRLLLTLPTFNMKI